MLETHTLSAEKTRLANLSKTAPKSTASDERTAQIKLAWGQWKAENAALWGKFDLTLKALYRTETTHLRAVRAGRDVRGDEAARAFAYADLMEASGIVDAAMEPMLDGIRRLDLREQ
jgi:hypothetical protein